MTSKLIEEYEVWSLKLNIKITKYMAIGNIKRFTRTGWKGDNKSY
jgi:hypothetical protein